MIILFLKGGLGNQMLQYALGRHLSIKTGEKLRFDVSSYQKHPLRKYELVHLNVKGRPLSGLEKYWLGSKVRQLLGRETRIVKEEVNGVFDSQILQLSGTVELEGYWSSPLYFEGIREQLLEDLTLKHSLTGRDLEVVKQTRSSNSIAIHIRRSDYVTDKKTSEYLDVCGVDYYQRAIRRMVELVENPHFFAFSDDIEWVKQNIPLAEYSHTFVDHNPIEKGYEDTRIMRNCKHFIIANSSFSWWGAWLSEHSDKNVIAPKQWTTQPGSQEFRDYIPTEWIRI